MTPVLLWIFHPRTLIFTMQQNISKTKTFCTYYYCYGFSCNSYQMTINAVSTTTRPHQSCPIIMLQSAWVCKGLHVSQQF